MFNLEYKIPDGIEIVADDDLIAKGNTFSVFPGDSLSVYHKPQGTIDMGILVSTYKITEGFVCERILIFRVKGGFLGFENGLGCILGKRAF